jgi:glutamate--cysteine ligase
MQVLSIAQGGLERRGADEAHFLRQLHEIAESGACAASTMMSLYEGEWGRSVDPLFKQYMY